MLRSAIALWRGEPLSGLPGPWAAETRAAWQHDYLDAMVAWADSEVSVNNPGAVVGPLAALAAEHPLTESLAGALMRALHAAGRSADALDHYAHTRHTLTDQLGPTPDPISSGSTRQSCAASARRPWGRPPPRQYRPNCRPT